MADLQDRIDAALHAVQHRPYLPKSVALAARHKKGIRLTRAPSAGETRVLASSPAREGASIRRAFALRGKPDWVVEKVTLSSRARSSIKAFGTLGYDAYPFHVVGHYSYKPSEKFHWDVPDVKSNRFDLRKAHIEHAALPFLGRTRAHGVE